MPQGRREGIEMDFGSGNRRSVMSPWRGVMWVAVLAGALFVVSYGMRGATSKKDGVPGAEDAKTGAGEKATTSPAKKHPGSIIAVLEPEPQGVVGEEIPPYLTDPATLKREEGSAAIGTFPFFYLLYQAEVGDDAKIAEAAVPAPGVEKMAEWEPGKAVSLEGTITSVQERVDLGIPEARMASTTQYRMRGIDGTAYMVFTAHPMEGVGSNDTVNVVGRYLRLYDDPEAARSTKGAPRPTPVIVARQVDGSRYLKDVSCLDKVRDLSHRLLAKPFYYLVNRVSEMGRAELVASVDASLTPKELERSPEEARGKAVAVDGNIIMMPHEWGETPNIAGTGRVYRTVLLPQSKTPVWVFTREKPKGFLMMDLVRARGLFMQVGTYSKKGRDYRALIVVARSLAPVTVVESYGLGLAVVTGVAIVVILLVIGVRIDRRTGRTFNRHVHSLAAKSRPKDLNASGRELAARIRKSKEAPGGASGRDDQAAGAHADESG